MARSLVTSSFSGSTPRRADHLVPTGQAVRAIDCKLEDGTLDSWREPRDVTAAPDGTKSFYRAFNCCWVFSTKCAHWAEGSAEQRHVFATGYNDFAYPVRLVFDEACEPTVYRLGLPCPADDIVATGATTFSKAASARQYLYQFEDSFGNVSGPSEVSDSLIVEEGAPVQLSGWAHPGDGWDVQNVLIYRSVSGYESVTKEAENKIDAAWMLVDRIPVGTASYVDTKHDADLQEAIVHQDVKPPPAELQGITWVRRLNCLAGFAGRTLYFSENNSYHNWTHRMQLDDTIKAIVESGGRIFVATDGAPYVIEGAVDCEHAGCRSAIRMPEGLPLVGSGYRSMVAVPSGAVYPTHDGLVLMSNTRAPVILTTSHYGPDDWHALHPDTARLAYHAGRIFAVFRKGAFCLALKEGASTAAETEHHTELSMRPDEMFVGRNGWLYLRFGDDIKEWNRGTKLLPHWYESGESIAGVPFNFGALQVIMRPGAEHVALYVDDDLALDEDLFTSEHYPLPLWATGQRFRWVLSGTANVQMLTLAPSTKEL